MPGRQTNSVSRHGQLATIDVAGERAGLHPRTLRRAIAAGELRGFKFGRALRIDLDELDRWIESKAVPNARTRRLGGAA